jgi:hypothetical protein
MEKQLSFGGSAEPTIDDLERMLIANIKIPIIVKEKDEIEYLNDYASIFFEKCNQMPEKQIQSMNIDFSQFFKKLPNTSQETPQETPQEIPQEKTQNIILTVAKEEIKPRKRSLNYSFKNKVGKSANITRKSVSE